MAISMGRIRRRRAQSQSMKELADKIEREQGKESKFGGLMGMLSPLAGFGAKGLLSALSIGTGGLLGPLALGLTTGLVKGSTEAALRGAGMGADTSKIKDTSIFGYADKEAKDYKKQIERGIKNRGMSGESLLADVGMSYVQALTPTIDAKGNMTGGKLAKELKEKGIGGGDGIKLFGGKQKFGLFGTEAKGLEGLKKAFQKEGIQDILPESEPQEIKLSGDSDISFNLSDTEKENTILNEFLDQETTEEGYGFSEERNYAYGGLVGGGNQTIAGYFDIQGKTLGGSSKKSLAELLGRK